MRPLPQDVPREVGDYEGPHAHRSGPDGDPRRRVRGRPVSGAQLLPAGHDGSRHGEAVPRPRVEQLSAAAGHPEPPAPLSGTAAGPDGLNEACVLQRASRSEEHTSELQSQSNLVCRLLLETKKNNPTPLS